MLARFLTILCTLSLVGACGLARDQGTEDGGSAAGTNTPLALVYTLRPSPDENGKSVLEVELEFTGDADGETYLYLGEPWADQRAPHRRFRRLTAEGGELAAVEAEESYKTAPVYTIKHAPGAALKISYRLHEQDNPDRLNNAGYFHSPVISAGHMQLIGWSGLAIPRFDGTDDTLSYSAKLVWADLPEGWQSQTSRALTGPSAPAAGPFQASVTLAGKIETATRAMGDKTLSVARYGAWGFSHDAFADRLGVLMTALNKAWQDAPTDYTVTLLPVPTDGSVSTITGTGLTGAFAAAASKNLSLDEMTATLTHEIAHNWVPFKLGTLPERGREVYWFSEGFTEFSARTVMREAGLMSQETFFAKVNEDLQNYYLSPARNAKVDALVDGFWTDPDIERQPYLRGFLLALNWEAEIRKHSNGTFDMGDALRALKAKAEQAEELPTLTPDYLSAHFSEWTGRDVAGDIARHINEGETIVPSADNLGACYELGDMPVFKYDVGFDVQATFSDGVVKGVVPGSNGQQAGLEDGMRLIRRVSGGQGDTSGPIVIEVAEGERVFQISYLPVSGEPVIVPQFKATQTLAGC